MTSFHSLMKIRNPDSQAFENIWRINFVNENSIMDRKKHLKPDRVIKLSMEGIQCDCLFQVHSLLIDAYDLNL